MSKNLYQILGIESTDGVEAIEAAYQQKVSEAHPDSEGGSKENFQEVYGTYTVLIEPTLRRAYDGTLSRQAAPVSSSSPVHAQVNPIMFLGNFSYRMALLGDSYVNQVLYALRNDRFDLTIPVRVGADLSEPVTLLDKVGRVTWNCMETAEDERQWETNQRLVNCSEPDVLIAVVDPKRSSSLAEASRRLDGVRIDGMETRLAILDHGNGAKLDSQALHNFQIKHNLHDEHITHLNLSSKTPRQDIQALLQSSATAVHNRKLEAMREEIAPSNPRKEAVRSLN